MLQKRVKIGVGFQLFQARGKKLNHAYLVQPDVDTVE